MRPNNLNQDFLVTKSKLVQAKQDTREAMFSKTYCDAKELECSNAYEDCNSLMKRKQKKKIAG